MKNAMKLYGAMASTLLMPFFVASCSNDPAPEMGGGLINAQILEMASKYGVEVKLSPSTKGSGSENISMDSLERFFASVRQFYDGMPYSYEEEVEMTEATTALTRARDIKYDATMTITFQQLVEDNHLSLPCPVTGLLTTTFQAIFSESAPPIYYRYIASYISATLVGPDAEFYPACSSGGDSSSAWARADGYFYMTIKHTVNFTNITTYISGTLNIAASYMYRGSSTTFSYELSNYEYHNVTDNNL